MEVGAPLVLEILVSARAVDLHDVVAVEVGLGEDAPHLLRREVAHAEALREALCLHFLKGPPLPEHTIRVLARIIQHNLIKIVDAACGEGLHVLRAALLGELVRRIEALGFVGQHGAADVELLARNAGLSHSLGKPLLIPSQHARKKVAHASLEGNERVFTGSLVVVDLQTEGHCGGAGSEQTARRCSGHMFRHMPERLTHQTEGKLAAEPADKRRL